MKYFLTIVIISFFSFNSFSQIYSGQLIDRESGLEIPYANIGIINKNVGTVSDVKGMFKIELDKKFDYDSLCISCIRYENKTFLIYNFKDNLRNLEQVIIELQPRIYQIEEVIIRSINTKTYTLGNFCEPNSCYGNSFPSQKLGTEVGVIISLPHNKNKAYLKNFRFYVGEFTFDKFTVRLNVYNLKNSLPHKNILTKPIFIEITSAGEYIIDLKGYNIITNGNFFVSLEYYTIPENAEGKLIFCAIHNKKINKRNGYYRLTSQGNWIREMFDNVGFSVQVVYE